SLPGAAGLRGEALLKDSAARLIASREQPDDGDAEQRLDHRLRELVDDDGLQACRPLHAPGTSIFTSSSRRLTSKGFSIERTPRRSASSRPSFDPVVRTTGTCPNPASRSCWTTQVPFASGRK